MFFKIFVIVFVLAHHCFSDTFRHVGCYEDKFAPEKRAMPVFIAKVASPQECFEKVKAKGWPAFGTQYGQECWSSKDADKTYWKHGNSTRCKNNMGNDLANDVWIIHYGPMTDAPVTQELTSDPPIPDACEVIQEYECSWVNAASTHVASGVTILACAVFNFGSFYATGV